jgi:hypothetical protein
MGWMTGVRLLSDKGKLLFATTSKLKRQFHRASYPVVSARGKSPWYETNHLPGYTCMKIRLYQHYPSTVKLNDMQEAKVTIHINKVQLITQVSLLCSKQHTICPSPGHINPAHAFCSYFFKIHFHVILPSMPRSSRWSSFHQKTMHTFPFSPTMPHSDLLAMLEKLHDRIYRFVSQSKVFPHIN